MRAVKVSGGLIVAIAAMMAGPASAQTAQMNEFEILCKLTGGDCMQADAPADARDRDQQRSFSLTRAGGKPQAVQAPVQPRVRMGQPSRTSYATAVVQPAPAPGRTARPALGVSRGDMMMTFLNGSADLTPQARVNAAVIAKAMNSTGAMSKRFLIEGHTNAVGTPENNYRLSQDRADALKAFLVSSGVDAGRLETKGFGFDRTLPGLARKAPENRRVEAKAIS